MSDNHRNEPLFAYPTTAWAGAGATVGAILVLLTFAVATALTDSGMEMMAIGAVAAGFGGVGFGAMLGGVLGGLRALKIEAARGHAH